MTATAQKRRCAGGACGTTAVAPVRAALVLFFFAYTGLCAQSPALEWARRYGAQGHDAAHGVATDHQDGVYWAGERFTVEMNSDIHIYKSDTTATFRWEHIFGSEGYDIATSIEVRIEQGEPFVYVLGHFSETVDFDPGPGEAEFTSKGATDVFLAKYDGEGEYVQAWTFGDHAHDYGWDLAIDPDGNMYVAGAFHGQVDFDPGPDTLYLTAQFDFDAFVLKLDTAGHAVFAASGGGTGDDRGQGVAVDPEGNVVTTGYFSNVATFVAADSAIARTAHGEEDAYVWRLNPQGETIWLHGFGAGDRDRGYAVTVDDLGNSYIGGEFAGTVDFDPGPGDFELTNAVAWDAFVQKLNAHGDLVWARAVHAFIAGVAQLDLDGSGHLFSTGYFGSQADLGTLENPVTLHSNGNDDVYMAMYDAASGQTLYAVSFGGNQGDHGLDLTLDFSGNIYLAGYFKYTVDFDPGPVYYPFTSLGDTDAFIAKWRDTYTGLETPKRSDRSSVYPNPAVSRVFIEPPINTVPESFVLFDSAGKTVASGGLTGGWGIDVSTLPHGLYVLTLTFADGVSEAHKMEVVK